MTDNIPTNPGRYGPTEAEGLLRIAAENNDKQHRSAKDQWRGSNGKGKGAVTRRTALVGAGAAGIAALGAQLVTSRFSFAAEKTTNTVIYLFLRGGADGLSIVVPSWDPNLIKARPAIAIPASKLLPLDSHFGLHPALQPIHGLWKSGAMAAVHAVASPDVSRSHFQAQDCIERGAGSTTVTSGFLDRALQQMSAGTTFRAVAASDTQPRSLAGNSSELTLGKLSDFAISGWEDLNTRSQEALAKLYTGVDHPLGARVKETLAALDSAKKITTQAAKPSTQYPKDSQLSQSLQTIAQLVNADAGLWVATVDVGGWDMHNNLGRFDSGSMRDHLTELGQALGAFMSDIAVRSKRVTIIIQSEFGRRVNENGNLGADHGHGGVMLLLGAGVVGGKVHGKWPGLAPSALDQGDVAGANDYRDVVGEVLGKRLDVSSIGTVFPGHTYRPLGVAASG